MPVKRDKGDRAVHETDRDDEVPADTTDIGFEPTVLVSRRDSGGGFGAVPDPPSSRRTPTPGRFSDRTRLVGQEEGPDPHGPATVVVSSGRPESGSQPGSTSQMDDPPAGWLVVVAGPGKGTVATLGVGQNSVGRDAASNRVPIDNGDRMLSRAKHVVVVYDPRTRKFYIQPGDGTNLAYIENEPVLATRDLAPGTHLMLGRTVLRFVPLCGDAFDWSEDMT